MSSPRELAVEHLRLVRDHYVTNPLAKTYLEDAIVQLQLGPTGDFPLGKLNQDDRGALQVAMTARDGKVVIAFGTPVDWIGLGPNQARHIASAMVANADVAAEQVAAALRGASNGNQRTQQEAHGQGPTAPEGEAPGRREGGAADYDITNDPRD